MAKKTILISMVLCMLLCGICACQSPSPTVSASQPPASQGSSSAPQKDNIAAMEPFMLMPPFDPAALGIVPGLELWQEELEEEISQKPLIIEEMNDLPLPEEEDQGMIWHEIDAGQLNIFYYRIENNTDTQDKITIYQMKINQKPNALAEISYPKEQRVKQLTMRDNQVMLHFASQESLMAPTDHYREFLVIQDLINPANRKEIELYRGKIKKDYYLAANSTRYYLFMETDATQTIVYDAKQEKITSLLAFIPHLPADGRLFVTGNIYDDELLVGYIAHSRRWYDLIHLETGAVKRFVEPEPVHENDTFQTGDASDWDSGLHLFELSFDGEKIQMKRQNCDGDAYLVDYWIGEDVFRQGVVEHAAPKALWMDGDWRAKDGTKQVVFDDYHEKTRTRYTLPLQYQGRYKYVQMLSDRELLVCYYIQDEKALWLKITLPEDK